MTAKEPSGTGGGGKKRRVVSPEAAARNLARMRARYVPKGRRCLRWSPEDDAVIAANSNREAARLLGVSEASVCRRRYAASLPRPTRRKRSPDEILALLAECGSQQSLAARLGVSKQRASQLVREARAGGMT